MNAKRFVLFFLVSLISININATSTYQPNKILEFTNKNWLTENTTDVLTNTNRNEIHNLVTASHEYQKLAQKIKDELAITQEITVCELDPIQTNFFKLVLGFAPETMNRSGILLLNVEKLDQQTSAEKQFAICRELFKMQHNDQAVMIISGCTVWPLSAFICYKLLRNYSPFSARHAIMTGFAAAVIGAWITNLVTNPNQKCLAHEADRFAAHALKCHACLDEVITARKRWSEEKRKSRSKYFMCLPITELRTIAQELKEKNCLCAYHRELANA